MAIESAEAGDVMEYNVARVHATMRVPIVSPRSTAAEIRAELIGRRYVSVSEIVVCDHGRLVGLINIEDLLAAPDDAIGQELMDSDPPAALPGQHQEQAIWQAIHKRETSLAVVDEQRQFLGLVPAGQLVEVLLSEHEEDLAHLTGVLRSSGEARQASLEGVWRRLWHRLPWIVIGLIGAFAAAEIVGAFEHELQETVLLALFIPGIVYLADAVGTQTETLAVRGLSVGVEIRRIAWPELLTGGLIGALMAAISFPLVWVRWGRADVAMAVAIALAAACSTATGVAMILPALLRRIGVDPAFGSGPLATVVQDLLSIVIYFAVAALVIA